MTTDDRLRRAGAAVRRAAEKMNASDEVGTIEQFDRFRRRKDRNRAIGAIALVATLVAVSFAVVSANRENARETPANNRHTPVSRVLGTVTITKTGSSLDGEMSVDAGPFTVTIRNKTADLKGIFVFAVGDDQRFQRMLAYVERVSAGKADYTHARMNAFIEMGGQIITDVNGGDTIRVSGNLNPGTYAIWCGSTPPGTYGAFWAGIAMRTRPADFIGPIEAR
jgi:hypothetical protein